MLGVSVKNGDFARLAFEAPHTIDLGTRCAAFMGQAVASAQQEGVPLEVITASLANSIAKNYLSKVVGTPQAGRQGHPHRRRILQRGRRLGLPRAARGQEAHRGRAPGGQRGHRRGAPGQRSNGRRHSRTSRVSGTSSGAECDLSTFTCKACDNNCTITRMQLPGEKPTFYGSRCDRYDSTLSQARRGDLLR